MVTEALNLKIVRLFEAPIEQVYAAWTEKELLQRWMCRDQPTHIMEFREVNMVPGGGWVLDIRDPNDNVYVQHLGVMKMEPPRRLVFTWYHEQTQKKGTPCVLKSPETLLTIELKEVNNSTELTLIHDLFIKSKESEETLRGWNGCLDVLEQILRS